MTIKQSSASANARGGGMSKKDDALDLNATNEYGVPLHACNGYRQDEHYWARVRHLVKTSNEPFYVLLREGSKNELLRQQLPTRA